MILPKIHSVHFGSFLKKGLLLFAFFVFVFFIHPTSVQASTIGALDSTSDAGETEDRTNIREPGTAEEPDDLKELNIANSFTITYDNGNGELTGTLRI